MHEYFSNFKKFIILKKIMWKKNFIWWKTSSFLGKIFNGKILRFFRQKWPLFWSKFLYFGYPENISGFRVLNVGFRVGFGYRPLGFGSGSGGLKCRVYPSGFRVFGSPDTSLSACVVVGQVAIALFPRLFPQFKKSRLLTGQQLSKISKKNNKQFPFKITLAML